MFPAQVRWAEVAEGLGVVYTNLTGDILISAGVISYIGAFTMKYRDELVEGWVEECANRQIPGSKKYSLNTALGNPVKVMLFF
jgi:dynein heavy chain